MFACAETLWSMSEEGDRNARAATEDAWKDVVNEGYSSLAEGYDDTSTVQYMLDDKCLEASHLNRAINMTRITMRRKIVHVEPGRD